VACAPLHLAHYRVLAAVDSGDERASRVAARLALGKPTVSAAVDALCQRGLLTRTAEVADQRAITLSLTEDGRALLAQVEQDMIARLAELVARAPAPDQVIDVLAQLGGAIDAAHRQRAAVGSEQR
jgi:DNA-binding MarR family transcriptional regulator